MRKTNKALGFQQTANKAGFLLESQGGEGFVGSVWNSTYDFPSLPQICLTFMKLIKLLFIYAFLFHVDMFQTTVVGTNPWKAQIVYLLGTPNAPANLGKDKDIQEQGFWVLPAVKELRRVFTTLSLRSRVLVTTDLRIMLLAPCNCLFLESTFESSYCKAFLEVFVAKHSASFPGV